MTILAAFQETSEGRTALARAITEARLRETDLVVLTAPTHPGGEAVTHFPELDAAEREHSLKVSVRVAVRPDHLADEVVDLGTELEVDMIVIGLRRRSPVGKLFLGSAAQDVLLNATVPVLSIRVSH